MQRFVIDGRLEGYNRYIDANRTSRYKGSRMKTKQDNLCRLFIRQARLKPVDSYPVRIFIDWFEPNDKRDFDNIVSAKKFIFDALQKEGIIENDNLSHISGVNESVYVDPDNPRIEVKIFESEED